MTEKPESCEVTEEDLKEALGDMGTYVDVTVEDLKAIYALALKHAESRLAQKIPVGSVMTAHAVAIKPDADVHEAARLLAENGISGLPVVDSENHVIGLISEADVLSMTGVKRGHTFRDVVHHILGEPVAKRRQGITVAAFMTSPAITVEPDTDMRDAARLLDKKRIKRLPVVDAQNRLVGIIARADIVRAMGT